MSVLGPIRTDLEPRNGEVFNRPGSRAPFKTPSFCSPLESSPPALCLTLRTGPLCLRRPCLWQTAWLHWYLEHSLHHTEVVQRLSRFGKSKNVKPLFKQYYYNIDLTVAITSFIGVWNNSSSTAFPWLTTHTHLYKFYLKKEQNGVDSVKGQRLGSFKTKLGGSLWGSLSTLMVMYDCLPADHSGGWHTCSSGHGVLKHIHQPFNAANVKAEDKTRPISKVRGQLLTRKGRRRRQFPWKQMDIFH